MHYNTWSEPLAEGTLGQEIDALSVYHAFEHITQLLATLLTRLEAERR